MIPVVYPQGNKYCVWFLNQGRGRWGNGRIAIVWHVFNVCSIRIVMSRRIISIVSRRIVLARCVSGACSITNAVSRRAFYIWFEIIVIVQRVVDMCSIRIVTWRRVFDILVSETLQYNEMCFTCYLWEASLYDVYSTFGLGALWLYGGFLTCVLW